MVMDIQASAQAEYAFPICFTYKLLIMFLNLYVYVIYVLIMCILYLA